MLIQKTISENFTLLKSFSILFVIASHFMKEEVPLLWVPAAFGLLIFGYSSAYFTSLKYSGVINLKKYWTQKLYRLGASLIVVNLFLLCMFLFQKKGGIFSWNSLVNIMGFGGFLNWLGIQNKSPFGAGIWFLTLLIVFYICYPILNRIINNRVQARFVFIGSIIIFVWLHYNVVYGHLLWLTSCGFICGFLTVKSSFKLSKKIAYYATLLNATTLIALNYLQIKFFNPIFLVLIFISFVQYIEYVKIKNFMPRFVSGYLFEIYLIHTYLFIRPTGIYYADFLFSLCFIMVAALILGQPIKYLRKIIFKKENDKYNLKDLKLQRS